eukprot:jgi/Mesen1/1778/ME000014S01185
MKSWRRLTGGASKSKSPTQVQTEAVPTPLIQRQTVAPQQPVHVLEEPAESIAIEDSSLEDEFTLGLQEVHDMREKYNLILKAAEAVQERAREFGEALKKLSELKGSAFGSLDDDDVRKVYKDVAATETKVSRLFEGYAEHVGLTVTGPTENLLRELDQVEDTKEQYDEIRQEYEQHGKPKQQKGDKGAEQEVKDRYDEVAMTLGCRLQSMGQRRPRSLLTQAIRHHATQMRLFKRGLQEVLSLEPSMRRLSKEIRVARTVDEEDEEEEEEEDDEDDIDDEMVIVRSIDDTAWQGSGLLPHSVNELQELPKDMPMEWSALLSGLDSTLQSMGAHTMDKQDAVFAMNAVLSAARQTGRSPYASARGGGGRANLLGSFSAPLSSQGTPTSELSLASGGSSALASPSTNNFSFLPSSAASGMRSAAPPSAATGTQKPEPLPQPFTVEGLLRATQAPARGSSAPSLTTPFSLGSGPGGYHPDSRDFGKASSRSGPLLSNRWTSGGGGVMPPFSLHMSGPLPSPSAVEQSLAHAPSAGGPGSGLTSSSAERAGAGASARHGPGTGLSFRQGYKRPGGSKSGPILQGTQSMRHYGQPAGPSLHHTSSNSSYRAVASSGPLPLSGQSFRSEPLHKSGPIGRSPLGDATSSPPRVSELYPLPPPPLNSSAPASFATTSALLSTSLGSSAGAAEATGVSTGVVGSSTSGSASGSASVSVGAGSSSGGGSHSSLRGPPGLAPLPLQPRRFTLPQPGTQGASQRGSRGHRPSVPTILSESEEGESPVASSFAESPPARAALLSPSTPTTSLAGLASHATAGSNLTASTQTVGTLSALGSREREELLEQLSRDDFRLKRVSEPLPGGVSSVPDWSAVPSNAREGLLHALASAVVSRRSQATPNPQLGGSSVVASR